MNIIRIVKTLIVTACCGFWLIGCESFEMSPKKFSTPDEHYQQMLETQKAGVEITEAAKKLPEVTVEELAKLGDAHLQQGHLSLAIAQYLQVLETYPSITFLLLSASHKHGY